MEPTAPFVSLGVALGVGLLIGFERQQSAGAEHVPERASMGGARTYPLVALAGALASLVSRSVGAWFAALVFVAVAALVAISYLDDVRRERDHGLTSEAAMLVAFLLGALAAAEGVFASTHERVLVVVATAVVVAFVLSLKPPLHALADRTTKTDVFGAMQFLVVAVVVLPFLPDRDMGPLDALNPFKLGLLVALLTGVGFAGYVAMRALGARRGFVLTGLFGGLASSTAVTLAAARHVRRSPAAAPSAATSVVLANTVMAARVLVVAAAFSAALLSALAVPVAAVLVVGVAASVVVWRRGRDDGEAVELTVRNPVELSAAVKMTLVVAAVLVATKAAALWLGPGGVYATSALAGTADVDAVTVSMAHLASGPASVAGPATAVLVAIASNTAAKLAMAAVVGGRDFGRALLAPAVATIVAAAAGVVWLWV